jgi:RimJ/RimL family protein N-acetyltransferase
VIPLPDSPLCAAGLQLRPLTAGDFAAVRDAREHPASVSFVNPLPAADGDALVELTDDARRADKRLHLAITDLPETEYLGEIALILRTAEAGESGTGEIAYVVAPHARGRGVATTALRLLSAWGLTALRLERLQLSIPPDDAASHRVADKAGFRYEGILRSTKVIRGERIDSAMYSLLPGDTII